VNGRRPTKLDSPPPGTRCPACWVDLVIDPRIVAVCPRCFVLVVCLAPERVLRLVPADLPRLSPADRHRLQLRQIALIGDASHRWRTLPRTPSRPLHR